ncbi:MAG: holo-ACP synthase [Actinomycetota bacterium]
MIGIDTVDIDRLRDAFLRAPGLERRLFTDRERDYCRRKADPLLHFAGTLAAKEAVIKAGHLGTLVAWGRRVEIDRRSDGAPGARIRGVEHGPIHVSISHDGSVAVAVAVADTPRRSPTSDGTAPLHLSEVSAAPKPNEHLLRYIGTDFP